MGTRWTALMVVVLLVGSCGSSSKEDAVSTLPAPTSATPSATQDAAQDAALMPDLVGLGAVEAGAQIADLGLGSEWRTAAVRCGVRPHTVVRQAPAAGAALTDEAQVRVSTAVLDVEDFRGPCEPADGDLGPVTGPDAALARQFYRFAADPSLGAPFADGDVWIGIEDGLAATTVSPERRADLDAWLLRAEYAEHAGPFSALDVLAGSGGYFEVHRGVLPTCAVGNDGPPADLAGLRAVTLTVPEGSIDSCMQWWGVTLFVEGDDEIRGVALRHGSP